MNSSLKESVAEIQGYYGSLHLAEKVFQKIWEQQDIVPCGLSTQTGKRLVVLHPGKWNHQEGPDFKSATIRVGGKTLTGDVELHLYPKDWNSHQHARDPEYHNVILHVTLFDGEDLSGRYDPDHHLVLLPYLKRDLEALLTHYLFSEAAGFDAREVPWVRRLLEDPNSNLERQHQLFLEKADIRWQLKKNYAFQRLAAYGWNQACHQMLMEVLGYSRNRTVMHRIALAHPFASREPDWDAEGVFHEYRSEWKLQGVRPANHPLKRLEAYHELLCQQPNWPRVLLLMFHRVFRDLEPRKRSVGEYRQVIHMNQWIGRIQDEVFVNTIGGSRLHTLLCDALLPLFSASTGRDSVFAAWYAWKVGDYPVRLNEIIRVLPIRFEKGAVNCNGWMQACLQLMLEQDQNKDFDSSP